MDALSKRDEQKGPAESWISLNKAAAALGVSTFTVLSMALDKQLVAQKFDDRWLFTRSSIDKVIAERAALAMIAG